MSTESTLNDTEVLSFTRNLRVRLVNKLTTDGTNLPTDEKAVGALNQTLNDMDRQALVLMRMQQDKKTSDMDRQAAILIQTLNDKTGNTNPFIAATADYEKPELDFDTAQLPQITLLPGETDTGIIEETYDDFMRVDRK